jgi:hypothetical protein
MRISDHIYFTCRAAQHHAAALSAEHPKARQVHLELAHRYEAAAAAAAGLPVVQFRPGSLGAA